MVKYAIIGAGPTGLGAAFRLKELGQTDFLVFDAEAQAGGLARSFQDAQGFTWDIGGHVQFSHYSYFDRVMRLALGEDGWLRHQRESWVWMYERFVPYPFQNNIRYLPKEIMWKCLQGVIEAQRSAATVAKPRNFREWIAATFGAGIAEEFMVPYNYKVWAWPAEKMSYQWIGERVAVTDLARVTENILFDKDDFSWGPNNTFQFPKQGGTGAIWESVAQLIGAEKFRFGHRLVAVDGKNKILRFANGHTQRYDVLLTTIPLDLLVRSLSEPRPDLEDRVANLKKSSSNIVGVGLRGKPKPDLAGKCWMYFPEGNCPFYRVTVFSHYSPRNVPARLSDGSTAIWSLMTETSQSAVKPVDREKLIADTIDGLLATRLIDSAEQVVSTWMFTAEYGYPTPTPDRDDILAAVLPQLDALGIYSRGRFGAWKYEVANQDHSMMQGVEWANRVVLQVPEVTLFHPAVANANYAKIP